MPSGEKDKTPMLYDSKHEIELQRRAPKRSSSTSWASPSSETVAQEPIFYTQQYRRNPPESRPPLRSGHLSGGGHRGTAAPQPIDDESGGQKAEKTDYLLNSGQPEKCNDPYCTLCPGSYQSQVFSTTNNHQGSSSSRTEAPSQKKLYENTRKRMQYWFQSARPASVLYPHSVLIKRWNKFFVISCLIAVFIDPLFFFVLSVNEDMKCIMYKKSFALAIAIIRSFTDLVYFFHILVQFRLAYVDPESRVVGAGKWIEEPKKIAAHYLRGYFFLDLYIVLPLPQVMILVVIPVYWGISAANFARNLLRVTVLLQYVPRIFRLLPLIAGGSSNVFIFESAWSNFVINLLMFILAGHVVGSCWYLFSLQRVNMCLKVACLEVFKSRLCQEYLSCRQESSISELSSSAGRRSWIRNSNATSCLSLDSNFSYGIYQQAPIITKQHGVVVRYVYSLFWGFQQISTLAGNQVPSHFVWEVLFTMSIIGLGLLLFALLIGNMQNFLQSLGKRRLEMQLRQHDVDQWMTHRRLSTELRNKVKKYEHFSWSATQGVNEEQLMEKFPENLQKEIRCHLFAFLKQPTLVRFMNERRLLCSNIQGIRVPYLAIYLPLCSFYRVIPNQRHRDNVVKIFSLMDECVLDAFRQVLTQKLYLAGSHVQIQHSPIDRMVFIVRGQMESHGVGNPILLKEGDVCGEELLAWHLEAISIRKNKGEEKSRHSRLRPISNRKVSCTTNVEAFVLLSSDLEDVTTNFERFLLEPSVQGAIRYKSPYWRSKAATHIQIVWRHRRWRRNRKVNTFNHGRHHHHP